MPYQLPMTSRSPIHTIVDTFPEQLVFTVGYELIVLEF